MAYRLDGQSQRLQTIYDEQMRQAQIYNTKSEWINGYKRDGFTKATAVSFKTDYNTRNKPSGTGLTPQDELNFSSTYRTEIIGINQLKDGNPYNDDYDLELRVIKNNDNKVGGKKSNKKGGLDFGALISDLPTHAPPDVRKLLEEWGDAEIFKLRVCRVPISDKFTEIGNLLTDGEVSKIKKNLNIDDFFHLYMEMALRKKDNTKTVVLLEKNQKVDVKFNREGGVQKGHACIAVPLPKGLLLGEFLKNGEDFIGSSKYWIYDAVHQNCQLFVKWTLEGNNLWHNDFEDFVVQNVRDAIPDHLVQVMRGATDIANRLRSFLSGRGKIQYY